MPRREQYVPKHRGPVADRPLQRGLRRSVVSTGIAVVATGIAVSSGAALNGRGSGDPASASMASAKIARDGDSVTGAGRPPVDLGDRTRAASRSDRRTAVDPVKERALNQDSGGQVTESEDLTTRDPRTIAREMLADFGFSGDQFSCLNALYMSESGWDVHADNPGSSAYGIPQALPGSKMASAGPDWADNPATQIRWGLGYIRDSYGSPCAAWSHSQSNNWY